MGLKALFNSVDPAGSRTFKELRIFERVLDTGERTIAIDAIATISVETRKRWLLRLLAVIVGIVAVTRVAAIWPYREYMGDTIAMWGLGAVINLVLAIALRDTTFLQIGAADGSRTIFRSKNRAFLLDVKSFLLKKINENNTQATNHYHFGDMISGDKVLGDKQSTVTTTHVEGTGNQVITGSVETRSFSGPVVQQAIGSPAAQVGMGLQSYGTTVQVTRIDFSSVLPQIEQMRQFYAKQPHMQHMEQRLSELEKLMRTGAPSAREKSRVRELAGDLGSILQAYPAVVQIFQHVARLVVG